MGINEYSWEEVLKKSFECYLKYGATSKKKLIVPHYWIREKLKEYFDDSYEFYSYGTQNSEYDEEYTVEGIAYDKETDITILRNGSVVGVVSFKFVSSNYHQNSNNYFENLLGECFNIQAKNIPFCHILVLRNKIPYYESNGEYKTCQKLKNHHLNKYINILNLDYEAVPKKICINVIEISVKNNSPKILSPKKFKDFDDKDEKEKEYLQKILDNTSIVIVNTYEDCSDEIKNELNKMDIIKTLEEFSEIVKTNIH